MRTSWEDVSRTDRGPTIYYGYCGRTRRYRMMDLPDYLTNMQQGVSRMMDDAQTSYGELTRNLYRAPGTRADAPATGRGTSAKGCCANNDCDCHCECCVCDADVLVHARCGEIRRIPITFDNDSRRERPVKLDLQEFVTSGGRNLGWKAQLSEKEFTLKPCDSHTVILTVGIVCGQPQTPPPNDDRAGTPGRGAAGSVDECEVGYAALRAEGCFVRPLSIAVAVLPDDCDAYRRACGGCCN